MCGYARYTDFRTIPILFLLRNVNSNLRITTRNYLWLLHQYIYTYKYIIWPIVLPASTLIIIYAYIYIIVYIYLLSHAYFWGGGEGMADRVVGGGVEGVNATG